MTVFTKLEMTNFRQYKGKHVITFTKGFNLIEGLNDLGKSGILYAILFAVYKYIGNYNAANGLITFEKDSMEVSLEYLSSSTNRKYRITRTVTSRNLGFSFEEFDEKSKEFRIILSSEIGTKENVLVKKISDTIGLDKKTFISVAYAKQKEFYSIVRGGSEIKKKLDDVLGINASIMLRKILRETIQEFQTEIQVEEELQQQLKEGSEERNTIERQLAEGRREVNELKRKVSSIKDGYKNWIALFGIIDNIRNVLAEIMTSHIKIGTLSNTIKTSYLLQLREAIKKYGSEEAISVNIKDVEVRQDEINRKTEAINVEISIKNTNIGGLRQEIRTLETSINSFEGLGKKAKCPTCNQIVSKEHIEEEMKAIKTQFDEKKEFLRHEEEKLAELNNEISRLNNEFELLEPTREENNQALIKINGIKDNIGIARQQISELSESCDKNLLSLRRNMDVLRDNWSSLDQKESIPELPEKYVETSFSIFANDIGPIIEMIGTKKASIESEVNSLEEYLVTQEKSVQTYSDLLILKNNNITRLQKRLDEISSIKGKVQYLMKNEIVIVNLAEKIRKEKLEELSKRTFYWYTRLVSEQQYNGLLINPENYELRVIPITSQAGDDFPVRSHSGGGNETLLALAERIALAELLKFRSILIFDEPTDATDSENIKTLIEGLARATQNFEQLILITHHGVGENLANNVIRVRRNEKKDSSCILGGS